MENRAHALVAGLFVVMLSLGVIVAVWWFAGSGQEYRYYELEAAQVNGLNSQAAVRFNGVRVGRVVDVDLDERNAQRVIVKIRVTADVPITRGTVATLGASGLTGQGFVQLSETGRDLRPLPTTGQQLPRIQLQTGNMEQMLDTARSTLAQLQETTKRLNRLVSEQNIKLFDDTLRNVAASTAHLEQALAQTPALVADLRRFSSEDNAAQLSETLRNLKTVSRDLQPAIANWNNTLAKVDRAAARIDVLGAELQGNTSETLQSLNQVTTTLRTTFTQLNRVIDDLQRSPQILLFGREAGQLGPGEQ